MARPTLLLADDSITIQKVVNLTFASEGIDVTAVGDGNSALDHLREEPPALVMADVNVPGVNGYEICEKVKSMDTASPIPVILLVGSFEPFDEEEARRVNADAHLTKPFESIAALVEMVNGFLNRTTPSGQQKFDDTVEYPTGHDMVASASSIPLGGGFEDETIEAERVGAQEDDPFEPVEGIGGEDTVAGEEGLAASAASGEGYREVHAEDQSDKWTMTGDLQPVDHQEQENSLETDSSPEQFHGVPGIGDETVPYGGADTFGSGDAEPEIERFDDAPEPVVERFGSDEPEPLPPVAGEPDDSLKRFAGARGPWSEAIAGDDEMADNSGSFPLPPSNLVNQRARESEEIGNVTVELDESELLELPVDPGQQDNASAETPPPADNVVEIDRMEQTIRVADYVPPVIEEEAPAHQPIAMEEGPVEAGTSFDGEVSEELVNEIARRVVERLSEKAVREIAWEVVPEMAELIIRKLAEQKMNE